MKFLEAVFFGLGFCPVILAQVQSVPQEVAITSVENPLLLRLETSEDGSARKLTLAADATGIVWLTLPRENAGLAQFNQGRWQTVKPSGFASTLRASLLVRLATGSVACLWKDGSRENGWVMSRHRGEDHSIWCHFELKSEELWLLPLAEGGVLITEAGRKVVRILSNGTVERFELPEALFVARKPSDDGRLSDSHVKVHAVQGRAGEIWLWSYAMTPKDGMWRLRGLVRFEGNGFRQEKLGSIDSATPLSAIVPWEAGTLAVAVSGVGLFEFDPAHDNVRRISFEGRSEELKYIEKIFRANGDWHFITTPRPTETNAEVSKSFASALILRTERFYDPEKRTTAVVRLRDKKLDVLTWKLDAEPEFGWADRPVVETPQGFWTCAKDSGLLFVMHNEEGVLARRPYDWRNGLPLLAPRTLAMADGGLLVAADSSSASAVAIPLKAPSLLPAASRLELVESSSVLLEDAHGGLFGVLKDRAFHRWKGGHWEKMKTPAHMKAMAGNELVADGVGQAWFIPSEEGMAAVCDLATWEWQEFESLEQALQARLKPGSRLRPHSFAFPAPFAAAADQPRRIAFLRYTGTLHLFDGAQWRSWKLSDIGGPDARVHAAPRFGAAGEFAVPLNHVWWQLEPSGQWRRTENSAEKAPALFDSPEPVKPEGCTVKDVAALAYDRMGVCWLTDRQRKLWKCIHGAAVQALQPEEINPARWLGLKHVLVDDAGNSFLLIDFEDHDARYLLVRPRLPRPECKARVKEVSADTVRLELGDAPWHAWRVDGGKWSSATQQKDPQLSGLLPGVHDFEVMAYNADLTPAKKPAMLKVTISAAGQDEVKNAIQAFSAGDLEASENAARFLRTQGTLILPTLRKARETANDRAQWWLDAVIQHLEAKSKTQ